MYSPFRLVPPLLAAALFMAGRAHADEPPRPAARTPFAPGEFGVPARPMTEAELWTDFGRGMESITRAFAWLELAFPDLRVQTPANVGDGVNALVLSWPMHLVGTATLKHSSAAGASLFLEPAFPTDHRAARGLAGIRVWGAERRTGLAAVLEGGGLVATDGSGAFAGGGPALGDASAVLALVGRRYFVLGADRWDFTLELTMPLYTLSELVGL